MNTETRIQQLAKYLDASPDQIFESKYHENCFEFGREEYFVLTNSEADESARRHIKEMAWAFRPEWLASHSIGDEIGEEIFKAIADNGKCEGNNSAILALVDFDYLVRDSILAEGRGHFISAYDCEEIELQGGLFAYRIN